MAFTKTLSTVSQDELQEAGQKALDLALLKEKRIPVPESFVVLHDAFHQTVDANNLKHKIDFLLSHADVKSASSLMNAYTSIRKALTEAIISEKVREDLKDMYESVSAEGVGLEDKQRPVRIIVSTNQMADPESNDTVIQSVNGWNEFLHAVQEAWALAYLPSQLGTRLQAHIPDADLRIALLVQVMQPTDVSVHAHSGMPEDQEKIYLEVYSGYTDLREKVTKDYYAITKENLQVVLSQVEAQTAELGMQKNDLTLVQLSSNNKDDKLIKRELEEIARLSKKAERVLQEPVKLFFSFANEQATLLWGNRLPLPKQAAASTTMEVVDIPEPVDTPIAPAEEDGRTLNEALEDAKRTPDETPEAEFAHAEHAATEAIMEAAASAEELQHVVQTEEIPGNVDAKLLSASLRLAMNVIEQKYDSVFGQVGDDYKEMIDQLNAEDAFSRKLDADSLLQAHNAVQDGEELPEDVYKKAVDEITFVMGTS